MLRLLKALSSHGCETQCAALVNHTWQWRVLSCPFPPAGAAPSQPLLKVHSSCWSHHLNVKGEPGSPELKPPFHPCRIFCSPLGILEQVPLYKLFIFVSENYCVLIQRFFSSGQGFHLTVQSRMLHYMLPCQRTGSPRWFSRGFKLLEHLVLAWTVWVGLQLVNFHATRKSRLRWIFTLILGQWG